MVPSEFSDFFAASAGVAGALIGLLFVAISVAPPDGGPDRRIDLDVRAGVAFSALTDALAVSLFALIPGVDLGTPALVVAVTGLASCIGLGIVLWRAGRIAGRGRKVRLLILQGAVFALQAAAAIQLVRSPHDASVVRYLAVLTVVFLLVGMARAWQLIGARDTGLIHTVRRVIEERPAPAAGPDRPATPD